MEKEAQSNQHQNTSSHKEYDYIKAKVPKVLKEKLDLKFDEAVEKGTHEFKGDFYGDLLEKVDQQPLTEIKEVEVEKQVKNAVNTWLIVGIVFLLVVVIGLVIALILNVKKTKNLKTT